MDQFEMNAHAAETNKLSRRTLERNELHVQRDRQYTAHLLSSMLTDLRYAVAQLERGNTTDTVSRAFDAFDRAAEVREQFRRDV